MFGHKRCAQFRTIRNLLFAIVAATTISLTTAGSQAAAFSFTDSVIEFLGLQPVQTTGLDISGNYNVTISTAASANGYWSGGSPDVWTPTATGSNVSIVEVRSRLEAGTSVVINTAAGGAESGDIFLVDGVSWGTNAALTLSAFRNVNINCSITAAGNTAGLTITPSNTGAGGSYFLNKNAVVTLSGNAPSLTIAGNSYVVFNEANGGIVALQGINGNLSSYYALGTDIDATSTSGWSAGRGFVPLGTNAAGFTGTFDGLRHTIRNLTIDLYDLTTEPTGFFGHVGVGGVVHNIGLAGGSISGSTWASNAAVGGLAGVNSGTISNSYSSASASCVRSFAGSLVGLNYGTITSSYATGNVTVGEARGGGFAGQNNGTITESYARGNVSGGCCANAGFVGHNVGTIRNSYSTGTASGYFAIGGFVGEDWSGGGSVYTNNFWDTTSSGIGGSIGAIGLTTAQMKQQASFTGWDFTNVWSIDDGIDYPRLRAFIGSCATCAPPPSGMVAWWPGNNNANDIIGSNSGTLVGAAYGPGKVDQAFSLNGSTGYVQLTDAETLRPTTAITLDAWVKLSAAPAGHVLIFDHESPNPWYGYGLALNSERKVSADINTGSSVNLVGSTPLQVDQWTHVAMTYDGAFMRIYVNGTQDGSLATSGAINYTQTLDPTIGRRATGGGNYFPGAIDEVEVFNRALNAGEVQTIYNAGSVGKCRSCTPPPSGMVTWWPGEGNANDIQGPTFENGTLLNGAAFTPGIVGQGFSLDGQNDYISVSDGPSLQSIAGSLSIDAWVFPTSFPSGDPYYDTTIVSRQDFLTGFALVTKGDRFGLFIGPGGSYSLPLSSPKSVNNWYHVAGTFDGQNARIYVNGILEGTQPASFMNYHRNLEIGSTAGSMRFFSGTLDEIEIFDRDLSLTEILAIFNAGSAGKCIPAPTPTPTPTLTPTPLPTPEFAINDVTAAEGNSGPTNFTFTITKTGNNQLPSTVTISTLDGTATVADLDYVKIGNPPERPGEGVTDNVYFAPDDVTKTVTVIVNGDTRTEPDENFRLYLNGVDNGAFSDRDGLGTIINDDCTPPPAGMISWWKGEANTNDSAGSNNGTWVGTPAYTAGKVGQAFSLSGQNYVEVSDHPSLRPTQVTVDAWVYPTNISGNHNVVFKGDHEYALQLRNGNVLFGSRDAAGGYAEFQGSLNVPVNTWSHVAVTHDGAIKRIYVNGQLDPITQSQSGHYAVNTGTLKIGTHNTIIEFFYGAIDEVEVLSGALSQAEIQAIYNAGSAGKCAFQCTQPPANMVAWWPGNGNANDIQGPTYEHGTLNGATFAPGIVDQAFSFDGIDDRVVVASTTALEPTELTIDAWIFIDPAAAPVGDYGIVGKYYSVGGLRGYEIFVDNEKLVLRANTTNQTYAASTNNVIFGRWNHVAATIDSTASKVYINGNLEGTGPGVPGIEATNQPFVIGARGGDIGPGAFFKGRIDEVEVFSRALSGAEIESIYRAGSAGKCLSCTPPPPQMVAWWPGEDNATDIIGGNNGTLQNGTTFGAAMVRRGFVFDGVDDLVRVPASPSLDVGLANGFTIDAWIKPANVAIHGPLVEWSGDFGEPAGDGVHFYASTGSGNLFANIVDTNRSHHGIQSAPGVITNGTFQHVALSYDKTTGIAVLYRNGIPVANSNLGIFTPKTSKKIFLGARVTDVYGDPGYRYNGILDEVEIFNRALSQAEINAIYNAGGAGKCYTGCVQPPPNLAGWWPGNNNTNDIVGGNNGTLINGAGYGPGEVGNAFSLNGQNQYILVGDPVPAALQIQNEITLSAWIYATSYPTNPDLIGTIMGSQYDTQAGGVTIHLDGRTNSDGQINPPGHIHFQIGDGSAWHATNTMSPVPLNQWVHIVATRRAGEDGKVYYNGVLQPSMSAPWPSGAISYSGAWFAIGKQKDVYRPFNGLIDEAQVYGRALTAGEVQAIYNAGTAGVCPPANTPPTITPAVGVTRQAGSPALNSTIATVGDAETAPGSLVVTVTSANPSNGVTISNIVNTAGTITADVVAACGATNASFTLTVTDGGGLTTNGTLNVTVTANTAPVLTYNSPAAVVFGQSGITVNPATGPSDNGSVASVVVQSQGTYTGSVSVTSGGVVTLNGAAPVGTHTITIRATDNCGATTDATFQITVNKASTTTALASNANPSVWGQNVTFTATISVTAPGAGTPTGTVTFKDNAVNIGTCAAQPVAANVATCSISTLSVGSHPITAVYNGDGSFNGSTSNTVNQVVNKANTTTAVTANPVSPSIFGQSVTFTATVAVVPPGAGSPTGTVSFNIDGNIYCANTPINGSFQATCTQAGLPALPAGVRNVVAIYNGDANFNSSAGTLNYTVNKANTTTAILSDTPDPSLVNQPYTVTWSVTAVAPGAGTPTGTVTVNGGTGGGSCTAPVAAGGCQLTPTTIGAKTISATYNGDNNFNTSMSSTTGHIVNLRISGTVTNGLTLAPIGGVTVGLYQMPAGTFITSAVTNPSGIYALEGQFTGIVVLVPAPNNPPYYDPQARFYTLEGANISAADFLSYANVNDVPRRVIFPPQFVVPGAAGSMPVNMQSQGNEAKVAFSFTYDTNIFTEAPAVVCGTNAPNCMLTLDNSVFGKVGVTIVPQGGVFSRPDGTPFDETEASTLKQIARINFQTLPTNAPSTDFVIGNVPTPAQVTDGSNSLLAVVVLPIRVVFAQGIEADVSGRNAGNGIVDASDVVQLRRFVTGIDTPVGTHNESQRADVAPSATMGNGVLDSTDVIQARRYVAGLDPPQSAGGPGLLFTGLAADPQSEAAAGSKVAREVSVGDINASTGSRISVPVSINAGGGETALSFTLRYDETRLANPGVELSANIADGAVLTANTKEPGVIRILIDAGSVLTRDSARGAIELVHVSFDVTLTAPSGDAEVRIEDGVISDASARVLSAAYSQGMVTVFGPNPPSDPAKANHNRHRRSETPDLIEEWLNQSIFTIRPRLD